jgi:hypothetical protein
MADSRFNGKTGEMVRYLLGVVVAVLASYYAAQNAINERLAVVETREQTRFEQNQQTLQRIERSVERIESDTRRTLDEWSRGVDRRTLEPLPLQRYIERNAQ